MFNVRIRPRLVSLLAFAQRTLVALGAFSLWTMMSGADQAAQQNAVMVEESAAGAMRLNEGPVHRQRALSLFKLHVNFDKNGPLALVHCAQTAIKYEASWLAQV